METLINKEIRGENGKLLSRMKKVVSNLTPLQSEVADNLKQVVGAESNSDLIRKALICLAAYYELKESKHPDFESAMLERDSNKDYTI